MDSGDARVVFPEVNHWPDGIRYEFVEVSLLGVFQRAFKGQQHILGGPYLEAYPFGFLKIGIGLLNAWFPSGLSLNTNGNGVTV